MKERGGHAGQGQLARRSHPQRRHRYMPRQLLLRGDHRDCAQGEKEPNQPKLPWSGAGVSPWGSAAAASTGTSLLLLVMSSLYC